MRMRANVWPTSYAGVCVRVYVCGPACMCACARVYVHACVSTYILTYVRACVRAIEQDRCKIRRDWHVREGGIGCIPRRVQSRRSISLAWYVARLRSSSVFIHTRLSSYSLDCKTTECKNIRRPRCSEHAFAATSSTTFSSRKSHLRL